MVKKKKKEDKSANKLPIAPVGRILNRTTYKEYKKVSDDSDSEKQTHEDSDLKDNESANKLPIAPVGRILNRTTHERYEKFFDDSDSEKQTHEDSYFKDNEYDYLEGNISDNSYKCIIAEAPSKKRKRKGPDPRKCHD